MTIHGIKIHEIGENKAFAIGFYGGNRLIHPIHVANRVHPIIQSLSRENVIDLANAICRHTGSLQTVQVGGLIRFQCIIMPIAGTGKGCRIGSNVRSRNHPADAIWGIKRDAADITANPIQFL